MPSVRRYRPIRRFRPIRRKRLMRVTWPGGPRQRAYFFALLPASFISSGLAGELTRNARATGLLVFFLVLTDVPTAFLVRLGLTGLYVGPNHIRIRRPLHTRTYLRSMLVSATAQAHPDGPRPDIRKRRITIVLHLADGKQVSSTYAVETFHLATSNPKPLEQYAEIRDLLDLLCEGSPAQRTFSVNGKHRFQ